MWAALRACVDNAVRRSNSARHVVRQVVARQPSVSQARARERSPCVFKGLNLSMYEAQELVNGHRQPNTIAEETRPAGRTLHHLTTFEHPGQFVHVVCCALLVWVPLAHYRHVVIPDTSLK